LSLPEFSRNRVNIDPDLYDLIPVLMESLSSELKLMANCAEDEDYELMRVKIHSSKGAALTFGFNSYAEELDVLRQCTLNKEGDKIRSSLITLKKILANSVFVPVG
jgi:chemotaxis protein histidine kinase CheA